MVDQTALQTIKDTRLRRRLNELESLRSPQNGNLPIEVEKEIHEIRRALHSVHQPVRPARKSAGSCINPKCRKRILQGQAVVKYGPHGLCCNFKCLTEAMRSN